MEVAYVNNGVSLGYYLPPNSDELKLRFESAVMGASYFRFHSQYQMIRHGAVHGSQAVDGSDMKSHLDYKSINNKEDFPELWKYFLHDGAYQWQHVFKVGGTFDLRGFDLPLSIFCDLGVVYSYYTAIDGYNGTRADYFGKRNPIHKVNTSEYPTQTQFIATVGFKIFP